jgi:hypothetical protein
MNETSDGKTANTEVNGSYPEIVFGVNIPLDFDATDEEMLHSIVRHSFGQIDLAAKTYFKDEMPDGVLPIFSYRYRESVENRHRVFLAQTIQSPRGNLTSRKANIVAEDKAAEQVVEDLSINRHPVSQLIEQLREEHGSHIGRVAMSDIVTSIIKHSAYTRFREILNDQIADWEPEVPTYIRERAGLKGKSVGAYGPPKKKNSPDDLPKFRTQKEQKAKTKTRTAKPKTSAIKQNGSATLPKDKVKSIVKVIDSTKKIRRGGNKRIPIKSPKE